MAIRHLVLFEFRSDAGAAAIDDILRRLNRLPALIPHVRGWGIHTDLGGREGSLRYALVAQFDDMDAVREYLEHPEHVAVVEDALPLLTTVAEHDHELPP